MVEASAQLLCVGDLNADVTVTSERPIAVGSDTSGSVAMSGGGSAANVTAWAAREGVRSRFAGVVGDDPLSDFLIIDLERHDVAVRMVHRSGEPARAVAVLVGAEGERSMVSALGTATSMRVDDIEASWFDDTTWLHLTAYSYFAPEGPAVVAQLVALADERSIPWSIDPSSAEMLDSQCEFDVVRAAFSGAAVLFPNSDEARWLSGIDDPEAAAVALLDLAETVVVTLGAAGAVVARRGAKLVRVDAVDIEVVNALGCGDAFVGGFLSGRLAGLADIDSARRGAQAAGRAAGLATAR